ncbi:hypothetical protein QFZ31_001434 [Neobacillus niacini]|uniref:hypothetical protein n=1 Tax=Neobacillus driksii TaxID=3035913 RepID=UPI002789DE90|nr:hypothetical protein [Neobacillus niacini]MDQ0971556.1 hypothetical protein [Neobacillus niacini]
MKLLLSVILLIIIVYQSFKFVQLLIKMKQKIFLPTTNEELLTIRKYPQKAVVELAYSKHKVGIIVYFFMHIYLVVMLIIGGVNKNMDWSFYLLLFLPLIYSHNLLNVFAIVEGGVMSGSRFAAWKTMKSFDFIPINANHKFYGYSKEVNNGYELIIKTKVFPVSCIITSEETKEKLTKILSEHAIGNRKDSKY